MPGGGGSGAGDKPVKTWDEVVKKMPESQLPDYILAAKKKAEKESKTLQEIMREIERNLKD